MRLFSKTDWLFALAATLIVLLFGSFSLTTGIYPWGDAWPSVTNNLANIPLYLDANGYGRDLFPAGTFPNGQSPYGVMDMAGNVWEWVDGGSVRGGSADPAESYDYRTLMRSANHHEPGVEKGYFIGFRCVIY